MSELDYRDNYLSLNKALKMNAVKDKKTSESDTNSKGLVRRLNSENYTSDNNNEGASLVKKILNKMDNVKKENEAMLQQLANMSEDRSLK
tara:strand:- start:339 stop:608 length:270 start_codon:yes stop_codon:yes gene_type:complete